MAIVIAYNISTIVICEIKIMDSEIYDKVKELALEIANAFAAEDHRSRWAHYQKLLSVCIEYEGGEKDHPFQWGALADFTNDPLKAIELYSKAYELAKSKELKEYAASISLAIAERYKKLGDLARAKEYGYIANEWAKSLSDLDLRQEISEFLLDV